VAARTPDEHLTWYVINYYGGLMTREEWLALRNFEVAYKVRHGYAPEPLEGLRSSDAEVLSLMRDGVEQFSRKVRDRILREHRERVLLNTCPKCGGLAMTPKAQQCRWCFHDWHQREAGPVP